MSASVTFTVVATPSPADLRSAIKAIEDLVGAEWLSTRVQRWASRDWKHPLISDFRYSLHSLESLTDGNQGALHNEQVLRVQRLGGDLRSLENATLDWAEFKARLRDTGESEKVMYEIHIAAAYARGGHEVKLHGAAEGCDMTVFCGEESAYLECKRKDRGTQRDLAARRVWIRVTEATLELMERKQLNGIVYVRSEKDPLDRDVEQVVSKIEESLEQFRLGNADPEVTLTLDSGANTFMVALRDLAAGGHMPNIANQILIASIHTSEELNPHITRLNARLRRGFEAIFEIGRSHVGVWPSFDATDQIKRSVRRITSFKFAYGSSMEQRDYVKGALQSLAEARDRLPPTGPGIVYIDIPSPHGVPVDERLEQIGEGLEPQLRGQNKRINALILTNTSPSPNPALTGRADELVTSAYRIVHEAPRTPLPPEFELM